MRSLAKSWWLFGIAIVWQVWLFLVAIFSDEFFPYNPSFPYSQEVLASFIWPRAFFSWANFDGVHYIGIALHGYVGTAFIQAFFPLYPLLVRVVAWLPNVDALLASQIVARIAFLGLVFGWLKFVQINQQRSKNLVWYLVALLVFPTSFFLVASYSESLFLGLVLLSFWAAYRRAWWLAAAAAALAMSTRLVGVFLVPALLFELLVQERAGLESWALLVRPKQWFKQLVAASHQVLFKQSVAALLILVSTIGLLSYMFFLWREFGDPLYFFHVQAEFGAGRQEKLIPYPQVVWRSLKILATVDATSLPYWTYAQEFVAGVGGLLALLWATRSVRWSYIIFSLGAFLLPTLTGTFSSMPRYVLVCFPILLLLGDALAGMSGWRRIGLLSFLIIVQTVNTMLFIQGIWVA